MKLKKPRKAESIAFVNNKIGDEVFDQLKYSAPISQDVIFKQSRVESQARIINRRWTEYVKREEYKDRKMCLVPSYIACADKAFDIS